jgi:hypothetical protein
MNKNHSERGVQDPVSRTMYQNLCMLGSLIIAIGLSIAFYVHALSYPACCDASQYVEMARHFETYGFSANAPHSDVRTFGYPLLLSVVSRAAGALGLPLAAVVFVVQLTLYFACVAMLHRLIARSFGAVAAAAVFYGLTFNVLLLPYLPLTMTDGMSVILLLCAAGVLFSLAVDGRPRMVVLRAVMLGVIVGFAVVVRPANLWFVALIVIGGLLALRNRDPGQPSRTRSSRLALVFVVIALISGFGATMPQSALNWARARQASPFPIYDLKAKQLDAGVRNIKYGTNMVDGAAGLFYRNPFYVEASGRHGIEWYFQQPLRGSATVALRMFAGFDFDYLFPYIYDLRPGYRPALLLFSQFIVFFGFGGMVLLMSPKLARRALGEPAAEHFRWKTPITASQVFIPLLVAWAAIHGVSAIENRFALPMVTVLMPVAVAALWVLVRLFRSGSVKRGLWVLAGFALWVAACIPLVQVLEQAKSLPPP